jgi:hypothetical protein
MKLIEVLVDTKSLWVKYLKIRFFANVHNGDVNRAPSSPITGHVQILKCSED